MSAKRPELPPGDRRSIADDGEFDWCTRSKRRRFARKIKRAWNRWTGMKARTAGTSPACGGGG